MESGIGLDVIDYVGARRALFKWKWYDQNTNEQRISLYFDLWNKYFYKTKSMYVPFVYLGVYNTVYATPFSIR